MTFVFDYPGCLNLNPARLKTQYKLNIFDPKTPAWVLSSFVSVNGGSSRHRVTKPPVCSFLSGVYFFNIKGADCIHSTRRVFMERARESSHTTLVMLSRLTFHTSVE